MGSGVGRYLWVGKHHRLSCMKHSQLCSSILHLTPAVQGHGFSTDLREQGMSAPKMGWQSWRRPGAASKQWWPRPCMGQSGEPRVTPHSCWGSKMQHCPSGTVAGRNLNLVPFHYAKNCMYITDGLIFSMWYLGSLVQAQQWWVLVTNLMKFSWSFSISADFCVKDH